VGFKFQYTKYKKQTNNNYQIQNKTKDNISYIFLLQSIRAILFWTLLFGALILFVF